MVQEGEVCMTKVPACHPAFAASPCALPSQIRNTMDRRGGESKRSGAAQDSTTPEQALPDQSRQQLIG